MKKVILFGTIILLLQSCAATIGLVNPEPNINLKQSQKSLTLVIDDTIKDSYGYSAPIDMTGNSLGLKVRDWRTSLANGFENGFKDYFVVTDDKSHADFVVDLLKADIDFVPADFSKDGVSARKAQITYKVNLLNNKGEIVNTFASTASAKTATSSSTDATRSGKNAIESMYEAIAQKFFQN